MQPAGSGLQSPACWAAGQAADWLEETIWARRLLGKKSAGWAPNGGHSGGQRASNVNTHARLCVAPPHSP